MAAAHLRGPAVFTMDVEGEFARYRKGCTGKLRVSMEEAMAANKRRGGGTAYLCGRCHYYHTSHESTGTISRWTAHR